MTKPRYCEKKYSEKIVDVALEVCRWHIDREDRECCKCARDRPIRRKNYEPKNY